MKHLISILATILLLCGFMPTAHADDQSNAAKPKPYPLDTCLVCGMKFMAGEKPFSFVYKGQEIKVCDKSEKTDFDKNPGKYLKRLADAEAKLKNKP